MTQYSEAILRAEEYAKRRNLSIEKQLGGGIQGVVFSTDVGTAVKSLIRHEHYITERNVYLRLTEHEIDEVDGFFVPKLISYHDELLVIEMQIVSPPFILDFASAYLDEPPPYAKDEIIMSTWELEKSEQFGSHWPAVQSLMSRFMGYGIYLSDVKPGNIMFDD